ncbi:MAG: class I SAM-dependent methyltransferase [Acidimicrobiia bacterium]
MVTIGDPYVAAARVYDLFYEDKDYGAEAGAVIALAEQYAPGARSVLDVGCGTGVHLSHLASHYARVAGVDVSAAMLDQARVSFPQIPFHQGDMRTFSLVERYDVVTCLFSAIGYMADEESLRGAMANMARHVAPGGVLLVEGWIDPADWVVGKASAHSNVGEHAAAARVMLSGREGDVSTIDMHYVIATLDGIEHVTEQHRLGLFTAQQYRAAVEATGLRYAREEGLTGRGLHVGISRAGA